MHTNTTDNIEEIYSETPIVMVHKIPEAPGDSGLPATFGDDTPVISSGSVVNALLIAGIGAIAYFFIWPKLKGR